VLGEVRNCLAGTSILSYRKSPTGIEGGILSSVEPSCWCWSGGNPAIVEEQLCGRWPFPPKIYCGGRV
jgi:hypothetical protein